MALSYNMYFKKLIACYIGKAAGGTLGMPYEGKTNTNNITYYNPYPTNMCGNDDLDLQVISLETIYKNGLPINRHHLSAAWEHLNFGPDEYSVALYNLRNRIYAPLSGYYGNKFNDGMGAAIRSELWAALAPGVPELAVKFAVEDACVDHYGTGLEASVFLTALESSAYTVSDVKLLIDTALSYIEKDGKLHNAVVDTLNWWNSEKNLFKIREKILSKYRSDNWSDCTLNICFIILAWLAGEGDFGKSICYAVNCGYDADCTAATLGSLLGIINPDSIEKKWSDPLGDRLILSPQILGLRPPDTMNEFCEKIASLMSAVSDYYNPKLKVCDIPVNISSFSELHEPWLKNMDIFPTYSKHTYESLLEVSPFILNLCYPENIALEYGKSESFCLTVINPTDTEVEFKLNIDLPSLFTSDNRNFSFSLKPYGKKEVSFKVICESKFKTAEEKIRFNITANGLSFCAFAGLITAFPWSIRSLCENEGLDSKAIYKPAYSFIQKVPSGANRLAIEMHPPMSQQVAVTCQGTRPLKLYINGELISDYDAQHYIPAVHRGYSKLANLTSKWNKIVIDLEDGNEGELFFAIGSPVDWIWLNRTEWRKMCE